MMKFYRRPELTPQIRIQIVIEALWKTGHYGSRTRLAQQHHISRALLYQWIAAVMLQLQELFSDIQPQKDDYPLSPEAAMLLLRMEGFVSIAGMSNILSAFGYPNTSTGLISQRLNTLGAAISNTLKPEQPLLLFWLPDELFAHNRPILITIEPISTAILRIELAENRRSETWEEHFRQITANQIGTRGACSDRGSGIMKGYQALESGQIWCSDHFHEFRDLVKLVIGLEKKAYAAIKQEHERAEVFLSGCSEPVLQQRLLLWEKATAACDRRIARYQQVSDALSLLFPALFFFEPTTGMPRYATAVKEELELILDLLDETQWQPLQKETACLRKHLDDICRCYEPLEHSWQSLSQQLPEEALCSLALAWQHDHQSHQHKGKRRHYHQSESNFWLEVGKEQLPTDQQAVITQVFDRFEQLVRASSLIEMVNSVLRPLLNASRGNLTQEQLNLFMFYYNHHHFHSGKRKGRSPMEILTGQTSDKPWYELLIETAAHS